MTNPTPLRPPLASGKRTCRKCGEIYFSQAAQSRVCGLCRAKRLAEAQRQYRERNRNVLSLPKRLTGVEERQAELYAYIRALEHRLDTIRRESA